MSEVRARALAAATRLGYPRGDHLPLLEEPEKVRTDTEVAERCLALTVVVAHAYGWAVDRQEHR